MKVQLLTFPGCPNAGPARDAVQRALALEQLSASIEEIDVTAADAPPWATRWGSPTVLVNGVDVAGAAPSPTGTSCRLYPGGVPPVAVIRARLAAAALATGGDLAVIRLHITGMDCATRVKPLAARLARVAGVATVDVDFDRQFATITHDGAHDVDRALLAAVADAGYEATVAS